MRTKNGDTVQIEVRVVSVVHGQDGRRREHHWPGVPVEAGTVLRVTDTSIEQVLPSEDDAQAAAAAREWQYRADEAEHDLDHFLSELEELRDRAVRVDQRIFPTSEEYYQVSPSGGIEFRGDALRPLQQLDDRLLELVERELIGRWVRGPFGFGWRQRW